MACDEVKPAGATDRGADAARDDDPRVSRLPVDVLAEILRRVPPRWLAASRCVCKGWRDAVDGRRLLRTDLLPLSLAGLFVHYDEHKFPEFLARPSSSRAVSGDLSFLPSASPHCGYSWDEDCVDFADYNIQDHCNGLLLLRSNCVVNPATRRWNTLPTCPAKPGAEDVRYRARLVYDPMVSPYYEVLNISTVSDYPCGDEVDPLMEESEWPPRLCKMYVFSSKSDCWEEKDFIREGDAAGTFAEAPVGYSAFRAIYSRAELYVHCKADFLMRVSLSNNTYRLIKPPMDLKVEGYQQTGIGKSEKGVYFVALVSTWHPQDKAWLRVWILNESCGQMEWKLKHDKDLKNMLPRQCFCIRAKWILEDINYNMFRASTFPEVHKKATTGEKYDWNSDKDVEDEDVVDHGHLEDKKSLVEKKLEWNSHSDSALNYGDMVEDCYRDEEHYDDLCRANIELLGFHPYKEIVFLSASQRTCLAYHLNGSKIEDLGNIYPEDYIYFKEVSNEQEKIKSFPYTPCWIEQLI